MLARQYRNGGEEASEKLIELGDNLLESQSQGIRFVRGGWVNPQSLFPRSEVVKVGYRIQDEQLQRIRWMYPDDSATTEPAEMTVMKGVNDIQFEVFNEKGWSKSGIPRWKCPKPCV